MRNVSKNKFLTCFRPVVDIDSMLEPSAVVDRSATRRFACIPVEDKHETKHSTTKSTFLDQDLAQKWVQVVPHPPKRTFSKVIKAVLFETVLNTRAHNKNRHGQNCFGSKRDYSVYTETLPTRDEKQALVVANVKKIKAPEWSSSISSSNSPVSESNISKSGSTKDQVEKQKKFQPVGIYWIVVSLTVTVFWGKNNAIILTSLLFCFFSLWNASCCWSKEVPKLRNAESRAFKNSRRNRSERSGRNKEHKWQLADS